MTTEQWRAVVGWEGYYEVSDHGRVRSVERTVTLKDGRVRRFPGREIRLYPDTRGHFQARLSRSGRHHPVAVHKMVLEAFVGPAPEGTECCHEDDDKANNDLSNLRWGTRSSNLYDRIRNGRHHNSNKTHCPRGHEYDLFYITPKGHRNRQCSTCKRENGRRYELRRKVRVA